MNFKEVIKVLETHKNDEGIVHFKKMKGSDALKSYGIGLTKLRKLAKQIGKNRSLALELWDAPIYDAKIIAILIDDPKQITRAQVERQVEALTIGHLAHVFSACGAPLEKTSFVIPLIEDWIFSTDTIRRRCGYGLLYEISKSKKKTAPDSFYFLNWITHISQHFDTEKQSVKGAMGGALMGIGKRNRTLHSEALKLAKKIGPISLNTDAKSCEPFDVEKHLTSAYLKDKLGI